MMICNVVGARPNFMKLAPVIESLKARSLPNILVHTGQHYDAAMSQVFFDELGLPVPDVYLGVGSDNQARQTARIMIGFDAVCEQRRPDLVIVAGDVNSTLACALVAAKRDIPVAHIEAGLRSFDSTMPEEVNRVLTDHISRFLFTTECSANENLAREGVPKERIHFVGNCMVDTLLRHRAAALDSQPWREFGLEPDNYVLLTLHRPSNVDDSERLGRMLAAIANTTMGMPVIFPVHPRARERIYGLAASVEHRFRLCDPLPYLKFLGLMARARVVLTDSGGVQEETTALGVPCLTLRRNTERPVTITGGTNRLVGDEPNEISAAFALAMEQPRKASLVPELWDGRAANRIADILARSFGMQ